MWLSDTDRSKGYAVDFLSVSLHAVSRDPEAYPDPCLYAQVQSLCDKLEVLGSFMILDTVSTLLRKVVGWILNWVFSWFRSMITNNSTEVSAITSVQYLIVI